MAGRMRGRGVARRVAERLVARCRVLARSVVDVAGVKMRLGPHLPRAAVTALCRGTYEATERRIAEATLTADDVVLEVGAGLGFISTVCAKRVGSERVVAYEANPALRRHILETYRLNGVRPALEMCTLGHRAGTQTFYVEKRFYASSTIRRSRGATAITVPVRSCNDEIRRVNPSFLIMDIEGGEYELMRGVDFFNVTTVLIEVHERVIGASGVAFVRSRLADAGFRVCPELSTAEQWLLRRAEGAGAAGSP